MYSPDYFLATNTAYETLMGNNLMLPIKMIRILKKFEDIRLISYSEAARKTNRSYFEICDIFPSDFGFLSRHPRDPWKAVIYYNDKKSIQTIRFTIAHELGHYVLGHLDDDDTAKKEANCYARNILCPVPIGCTLQGNKVEKYMELFDVSEPMAEATVALTSRDLYYISDKMYTKVSVEYEFYKIMKIMDEFMSDIDFDDFPFELKKAP